MGVGTGVVVGGMAEVVSCNVSVLECVNKDSVKECDSVGEGELEKDRESVKERVCDSVGSMEKEME